MDPVFIAQIALVLVVFHALLLSAAAMVWAERKVAARLQQRFGPTYTGPAGLLQPFADVFKLFFKEELRPAAADKILFYIAPVISAGAAFSAFCVVPFGPPTDFWGLLPHPIPLLRRRRERGGADRVRHRVDGRLRHRPRGVELATASTRCSAACARRRR